MTCLDSQKAGGNKTHFIDKLSHKLKPTSIGLDAIHISKSLQKNDKQVLSFVDFPHQRNSTMLLEKKKHMHTGNSIMERFNKSFTSIK